MYRKIAGQRGPAYATALMMRASLSNISPI
jgi:hypothetical protein